MEEGDVQLDPQLVIESLSRQVADKARENAMKDAMIFQQHQEIIALKQQIDELAPAISKVREIGKKEGKDAEAEDGKEERKTAAKG